MKTYLFSIIALTLLLTATSYADRALSRSESLGILQGLAATPTSKWVSAGTIEATHVQYRAPKSTDTAAIDTEIQRKISAYQANPDKIERTPELQKMALEAIPFNVRYDMGNEYTMTSSVMVKYDGSRFSWSIKVASRSDSVTLPPDLKGNYAARYFNMTWNGNRAFTWDGEKYTIQMVSANQAVVDAVGALPHNVNGPLTAGVIPWGYGSLTPTGLSSADVTGSEVTRNGKTEIDMTVRPADGSTMTFTLDPSKNYAVTAYTWRGNLNRTFSNHYAAHKKIGRKWIPMTILVEQRDLETNRLLKSDKWDFTRIDTKVPTDFRVSLASGARVEYYSPLSAGPAVYNYSNMVNTDRLLADRLAFCAAKGTSAQNCATAALKYVASCYDKTVSDEDLAGLVGPDGKTNLYTLNQAIRGLGIQTRAVKMDLAALKTLGNCKAILHIPGKDHFVVADSIQGRDAWLVDLSADKFYYRTSADLLPIDWSDGIALLVSAQPITGSFADVGGSRLTATVGGSGWSCTEVISTRSVRLCDYYDPPIGCQGEFAWYYYRLGCAASPTGTCSYEDMPWCLAADCYQDILNQYNCELYGEWVTYYIWACG